AECLYKEVGYACDEEKDVQYFEVENSPILRTEGPNELKISHDCLDMIYSNFLDELSCVNSAAERGSGYDIRTCREWWTGKSEMSKKLLLKQILEKYVGLNVNPLSFNRGCLENQRRRNKINAAKLRIQKIIHPSEAVSGYGNDIFLSKCVNVGKKRKMQE
ncbi:hypothetical protein ACH5RR_015305, partial [Cinchona calisaya]